MVAKIFLILILDKKMSSLTSIQERKSLFDFFTRRKEISSLTFESLCLLLFLFKKESHCFVVPGQLQL